MHRSGLAFAGVALVAWLAAAAAPAAQESASERLLRSAADAMGGLDRLRAIGNFVFTGFGQQVYQDGGGNSQNLIRLHGSRSARRGGKS